MVALIANKTVPSVSARTEIITEENGVLYPTVTGMLLIGKEERLQEVMPTAKASFQVLERMRRTDITQFFSFKIQKSLVFTGVYFNTPTAPFPIMLPMPSHLLHSNPHLYF